MCIIESQINQSVYTNRNELINTYIRSNYFQGKSIIFIEYFKIKLKRFKDLHTRMHAHMHTHMHK